MSLICIPVFGKSTGELARAARSASVQGADIVELRLDRVKNLRRQHLRELRRKIDFLPVVATLRPVREGGFYRGKEGFRRELLEEAIECGFDYVDLELGIGAGALSRLAGLCRERGVKSIVSFHDASRTPGAGRLLGRIRRCAAAGDIGKVACRARSPSDTLRIIEAAASARKSAARFIAIGMGEHGRITRVLWPFLGSEIVYASLGEGRETASGQPTIGELRRTWGSLAVGKGVTPSTGLYGLIGCPLGHSLSPAMHTAAFESLGIDAVYLPFEVRAKYLEGTLLALRALGLRGANVTIPYKERIIGHLDGLEGAARRIGAVNTVLNRNGKLIGYNTDVRGFLEALKEAGVRLRDARALVIGAGGAARAAVWGLLEGKAHVTVAARTRKRALALRRHLSAPGLDVVDLPDIGGPMAEADLLVNCTPVGMRGFPPGSPVPVGRLRRGAAVLDMVYNPVRTPLLARAERRGARTISGLEMFLCQGRESFRIWTGRTFPLDAIRRALADSQNRENRG